jgi:hypothetical protein
MKARLRLAQASWVDLAATEAVLTEFRKWCDQNSHDTGQNTWFDEEWRSWFPKPGAENQKVTEWDLANLLIDYQRRAKGTSRDQFCKDYARVGFRIGRPYKDDVWQNKTTINRYLARAEKLFKTNDNFCGTKGILEFVRYPHTPPEGQVQKVPISCT